MGKMIMDAYGSRDGFAERISRPATSPDSPMHTLDNGKSFNTRLTCPSTGKFIEVSAQILSTGDISATVKQDLDMDGVTEYTYQPPFNISGVCANGVISCDAGTWIGCKYYMWAADANARVSLQEAPVTKLGGCYCINNSCNAQYVQNHISTILKDIGGGVAGAVQTVNPKYTVTDVKATDTALSYYGQNSVECSKLTKSGSPEAYYGNPGAITGAADAELAAQIQDSKSPYSLVRGSALNSNAGISVTNCDVKRNVTVQILEHTASGGSTGSLCVDHSLYARVYRENDTTYHLQLLDTGPGNEPHKGCDSGGGGIGGWHTLEVVTIPRLPASFYFCVNFTGGDGCAQASSSCVTLTGQEVNVITCPAGGTQNPSFSYNYAFTYKEDILLEAIDNQCKAFEIEAKCKLRKETVDGVVTRANFSPTGNNAAQSCKTFSGVEQHEICRDWWTAKREYFCYGDEKSFDFTDMKNRSKKIHDTAAESGSTLNYQDLRKDKYGNTVTEPNSIALYKKGAYGDCETSCKTRAPKDDTQAGMSCTTSGARTGTSSYDVFYKRCSNGACPLEQGEELITDCQCMDDFADAASIMEALKEASKDIMCSSTAF